MKYVCLVGFADVGIRKPEYRNEHGLIKLGHVGILFEGVNSTILGFHPTPGAIHAIGGEDKAYDWLRNRKRLDGSLQNDTFVFDRAFDLSTSNSDLTVWQLPLLLPASEFDRVVEKASRWHWEQNIFPYMLPPKVPTENWDNCATFPRRLGLSIPESTGQLFWYIEALRHQGNRWIPKDISS